MTFICDRASRHVNTVLVLGVRASLHLAGFALAIETEGRSWGHYFWVIPTSVLLNLTNIILTPVIIAVRLIAATIFSLLSCCSLTDLESAKQHLFYAVWTPFDGLIESVCRIFFPSAMPMGCFGPIWAHYMLSLDWTNSESSSALYT